MYVSLRHMNLVLLKRIKTERNMDDGKKMYFHIFGMKEVFLAVLHQLTRFPSSFNTLYPASRSCTYSNSAADLCCNVPAVTTSSIKCFPHYINSTLVKRTFDSKSFTLILSYDYIVEQQQCLPHAGFVKDIVFIACFRFWSLDFHQACHLLSRDFLSHYPLL